MTIRNFLLCLALFLFFLFYWTVGTAGVLVFLEDERDLGNGHKLCIYTEGVTTTIPSYKICPVSIEV